MLKHFNDKPAKPQRVLVLGGGGFIAGAILRALAREGIATVSLGRPALDLLEPGAADRLAAALEPQDTVVFASARAPCKNLAMLADNVRMAEAVCDALARSPVAHLIYISSDAVYKDSASALTEASCAEPGSLHGVMHLAREVALRGAFHGPLALVRPTLVYGVDDPHSGYGPNKFRRLASAGQDIVLFGDGEERRDHVFVEDIAELVRLIVLHRSAGIANAVSGEVVSFKELAEFVASEFEPRVNVRVSPRAGPMPHGGYRPFDNSELLRELPGFAFTGWRGGLAKVHVQHKRLAA